MEEEINEEAQESIEDFLELFEHIYVKRNCKISDYITKVIGKAREDIEELYLELRFDESFESNQEELKEAYTNYIKLFSKEKNRLYTTKNLYACYFEDAFAILDNDDNTKPTITSVIIRDSYYLLSVNQMRIDPIEQKIKPYVLNVSLNGDSDNVPITKDESISLSVKACHATLINLIEYMYTQDPIVRNRIDSNLTLIEQKDMANERLKYATTMFNIANSNDPKRYPMNENTLERFIIEPHLWIDTFKRI